MQKIRRNNLTVIQGKKDNKPQKRYWVWFLVAALFVPAAVWGAWSVGRDAAAKIFVHTVVAREGVLENVLTMDGVIVRQERLVAAPATGTLKWLVQEGERLSSGSVVAEITTAGGRTESVTTPEPGIISKQLDGLEGILQPGSFDQRDLPELLQSEYEGLQETPQENTNEDLRVQYGTLLFKVIDNFAWYYFASYEGDCFSALPDSGKTDLMFSFDTNTKVQAQIQQVAETDGTATVVFKLTDEVRSWHQKRFCQADVITTRTRGIIIPASALLVSGKETGVFYLDKSIVRYAPVQVLEAVNDQVAVTGIKTGRAVITNPSWVQEGQTL